jgi:probable phosphoglycerate mutase
VSDAVIYTDGGSRGNPGPAGAGAVILQAGKAVAEISEFLGVQTNNVAEYTALVLALKKALQLGISNVEVRMDSELIVKQMQGKYKVKHSGLKPLFIETVNLSKKFLSFRIAHVPREENSHADQLANAAMDAAAK